MNSTASLAQSPAAGKQPGGKVPPAANASGLVADDISQYAYKSWDELFSMPRPEVEDFQLRAARRRFEDLMPRIAALRDQAEQNGVTRIDGLDDVVPLLFNHSAFKSYPLSLLENNRFDMLTKWLSRMTTIDLSGIDASRCEGIDDWLDTLERETPLQIYHTSGTTGKLSFIPRTTLERDFMNDIFLASFMGFRSEPGTKLGGSDGERMPGVHPSWRYGRGQAQRSVKFVSETVAPSPDQVYTLSDGTLGADLMSLSGRIRVAQSKGELGKMKLSESQRIALKRYLDEQARRPQETADFFERICDKLHGQRVFLFSQTSYLVQASVAGLARGLHDVFAPDSVGLHAGGGKGVVLPPDYNDLIRKFTGMAHWNNFYGMTELNGVMKGCPQGFYHLPPYVLPFLLDPETGAVLPREGRQTGRFAALDLTAQHYWGGIITGDRVTVEWDRACPCGRKGAHIHKDIERYESKVTGDDKVTCSAAIDNTDAALQLLLAGK